MTELEREELEAYRTKSGCGEIAAYYLLAEELGIEPGGSVVDAVTAIVQEHNRYKQALEEILEPLNKEPYLSQTGRIASRALFPLAWEAVDAAWELSRPMTDVPRPNPHGDAPGDGTPGQSALSRRLREWAHHGQAGFVAKELLEAANTIKRYEKALEEILDMYRPSAPDMSGKSREPNCLPRPGRVAFNALYPPASISV